MKGPMPIQPEDWIEKSFEFWLPVRAFPSVMERVRGTPARLEELIRSIPTGVLTARIGEEWSIQEHVGHLYDLDELHEGRLEDFRAGREVLRAADMTNRKTYEADHNSAPIEDLLSRFRAARARFVERLEQVGAEEAGRSALHPRLKKPMRVIDLVQFVAEHDDHHLASIRYLARQLMA